MNQTKIDQNLAGKTFNPIAPCLASRLHCGIWPPTGLGNPHPMTLLFAATSLFSWTDFTHCLTFLDRGFMFLASPASWGLHCSLSFILKSFMYHILRVCLQGLCSFYKLPGFQGFLLKSVWNPQWPQNAYTFIPEKPEWHEWCQVMLPAWQYPGSSDHGNSGFWVPGWLNVGKHFLRWSCMRWSCMSRCSCKIELERILFETVSFYVAQAGMKLTNLQSSCLSLPGTRIIGMCHHVWCWENISEHNEASILWLPK
jgi:hypothetical protein